MKHQYVLPVEVEWQPEGIYYAECPLIPGCHVEAETVLLALEYLQDVARVLLEIMQEEGEPVPAALEAYLANRPLHQELMVALEGK